MKFKDKAFRDEFTRSKQYNEWNNVLMELLKSIPKLITNYELFETDNEIESKIFDLKDDLMYRSVQLGLYYKSIEDADLPEPPQSKKVSEDFEVDLQAFSKNVQELTLKTIDFKRLSDEELIEVIKDLQIMGIEDKIPEAVLQELKDFRASME